MKIKILDVLKTRDQEFLKKFCEEGTYINDDGSTIKGVCRPVPPQEILNFMHSYDTLIIDAVQEGSVK